jgi:hypothetical protein
MAITGRCAPDSVTMWQARCECGRGIVVPTSVIEAIVRDRPLLRRRGLRLGPVSSHPIIPTRGH